MLQRKPVNRLGYNGINEIKEHPWLKYYPWKDLYEKNLEAPFSPRSQDNYDKKYCEGPDKIGNDTLERYQNYYKSEALNEIFMNYSFDNILTIRENTTTKKPLYNPQSQTKLASSTNKKKSSTLSASINNLNKNSVNQLLNSKMKITESLYLNKNNNSNINNRNNNNSKSTLKISSSISSFKTPNQTKNYSDLNLLKNKNRPSIGSASSLTNKQLSATPYRFNNEKILHERLPFIDHKSIVSKHVSSHSLMNKKIIINKPSFGSSNGKHVNKYISIGSSSTGSSNSAMTMNFLHRRSGSTNIANKY